MAGLPVPLDMCPRGIVNCYPPACHSRAPATAGAGHPHPPWPACTGRRELLSQQALSEHRPPPGRGSPFPQAGVPGPQGATVPSRPSSSTHHRLGGAPAPPWLVCPGRSEIPHPPQALLEHRPPPGQDSPSPLASVPGPRGAVVPSTPSLSTDHRLGGAPRFYRLVCPGHWEVLPPKGPPRAPTTASAALPVPPRSCTRTFWGLLSSPQALFNHRPPPRRTSPSPGLVSLDFPRATAPLKHNPPTLKLRVLPYRGALVSPPLVLREGPQRVKRTDARALKVGRRRPHTREPERKPAP